MNPWMPNPEHRLARRLGVLVLALFQLAAVVALPAADGLLDVELYGTPTHVESQGTHDCTPHHDHAFCQVLRVTAFATPARAAAAHDMPRATRDLRVRAPSVAFDVEDPVLRGSSGPRAPPTA